MDNSLTSAPILGPAIQRYPTESAAWSADSLRGGLLWFGLTLLTAALGGLASAGSGQFYASLQLPSWAPPASVFGPVWSVLYLLMAMASWLVWRHRHRVQGDSGLLLFSMALLPNALWTWLFFSLHQGFWALLDISVLWVLVGLTVRAFWRVRPVFGLLLVPLWVWVSFAGGLNAVLWRMNPSILS